MVYTVSATEKTNQKATEHETKAMLYLMNFRTDSDDIFYFVIDFFNDVTGVDAIGDQAWDVQSKASKNLFGKEIGKYLVTLYKNYLSDLKFTNFILFLGGVADTTIVDSSKKFFNIDNFKEKAQKSIFEGLSEESTNKDYIDNKFITESNMSDFISKVTFVIDDSDKADHIKKIIKVNPSILPNDEYLNRIFDQIRDCQSIKKNKNSENITINTLVEFERYKKYLTSNEIKLMVLSRLVHKNGIKDTVPISFLSVLNGRGEYDSKELIEECQNDIYRMLCDKNNVKAYWELFENIYTIVSKNKTQPVEILLNLIDKDKLKNVQFLNFNSAMYFIALIKDGLDK